MRKKSVIFAFSFILFFGLVSTLIAGPVDLSTWDTYGPVTFEAGGYSATLSENENGSFGPTSLENRNLLIPENAVAFSFDYNFTRGPKNEDYFDFYFNNISAPELSVGGLNQTLIAAVSGGSYFVSLVEWRGDTVPIIFGLHWGFGDVGYKSFVTIDNVEIATGAVPIPGSVLLLLSGLAGLAVFRNRIKAYYR